MSSKITLHDAAVAPLRLTSKAAPAYIPSLVLFTTASAVFDLWKNAIEGINTLEMEPKNMLTIRRAG